MNSCGNCKAQRGAALLLLMLALVLATSVAAWRYLSSDMLRNQKMERTVQALATAKAALLARAATDENTPGSLPCPDTNDNGTAELFAGTECPNYVGRFPYRTLEMEDLRDGEGERLWYAISRNFRDAPNTVNAATASDITFNGDNQVIAVVFSAGPPLAGQSGRISNTASDYLDGSNGINGSTTFVAGNATDSFNDIALPLRKDEWLKQLAKRILGLVRGPDNPAALGTPLNGLRAHHQANGQFPDAPLATASVTFDSALTNNGWIDSVTYAKLSPDSATLQLGTISITVTPCISAPCP